jgi:type IV pilus assembly protein PilP
VTVVIALGLIGLAGCGPEPKGESVANYEQQRAEAARRNPVPLPAGKKGEVAKADGPDAATFGGGAGFTYSPNGRRDPFRSFVLDQARERRGERGPLEQFDLSQLSLVAVVWNTERPRALVLDPSGRAYIVSEGTLIGKNDGAVQHIGDNTMIVREAYVDYVGERTEKEIELHVRQSQGG